MEFLRAYVSGHSVTLAHQVAVEWPAMAGAAFLLPGMANGNARIYLELGEIRKRLEVMEGTNDHPLHDCTLTIHTIAHACRSY